jgi:glycine/D-amino acid oxidase-like deaminating enzyme
MLTNRKEYVNLSAPLGEPEGIAAEQGAFDYIIIGQGICGTLLSWYLLKEGKRVLVIDEDRGETASKVAAGIINPVTGRRYVASWMIDVLLPFVKNAYRELAAELRINALIQKDLVEFFPTPQMRDAFVNRVLEDDTYLHSYPDQNRFNSFFHYDFGCGIVQPVFMVYLGEVLSAWKELLLSKGSLLVETFAASELELKGEGVRYKGYSARCAIFCDGIAAMENPWFRLLPFSAVKGEALIIDSPGLNAEHLFKKGLMLAPLQSPGRFWVGSNYQWTFEDDRPSETFLLQTTSLLKHWLKLPFEVVDHKAAVRPATIERRPFVGFHPLHPQVSILNGMGTKGTSLAPFFAYQLAQHLVHGLPLMEEVNVSRFQKILTHLG